MVAKKNPPAPSARVVLAENMRWLRAQRQWSQEDLALECDLHRTFIGHVERGGRNISLDNIERIARALEVPIHDLLRHGLPTQCAANR